MKKSVCEVHSLGLIPYQQAWDLQNQYAVEIAAGKRNPTLLLLEHPHTYTFGRRGNAANLLWDAAELARSAVSVHWVDRGGDVTYHGPGQLVGYPLISLGFPSPREGQEQPIPQVDYVGYIRKLEQVLILALGRLGVTARQLEGLTGIWVEQFAASNQPSTDSRQPSTVSVQATPIAKLAAIGVKVDARGVTRHGFALNVNPDMSYWEGIIGCGLTYPEISLAQLVEPIPTLAVVSAEIIRAFGEIFGFDLAIQ